MASQMRTAFASIASNTGSSSPGELLMTCSTSDVAASCSSASSRSCFRRSNCSAESAVDACVVGPLRTLGCVSLHRLSSSTASLHVAPLRGFTTRLNPTQILTFAPRQDVRFGSKADICSAKGMSALPPKADMCGATSDVCFVPIADMTKFYSITTSAVASSAGDIASPSALAAFRFTTSSYFVGACTGRSAGFSPLRMRST